MHRFGFFSFITRLTDYVEYIIEKKADNKPRETTRVPGGKWSHSFTASEMGYEVMWLQFQFYDGSVIYFIISDCAASIYYTLESL